MTRFAKGLLLTIQAFVLVACGGGGGGGDGFLGDRNVTDPLVITTSELPEVDALPYATVLEASGGSGAYTWSLVSDGNTGFTLDSSGVLRGDTRVDEGTYGLTFRVQDAEGTAVERSITLLIAIQPLLINTTALPDAEDGVPYSSVLEASGGRTPYSWTLLDNGGTSLRITSAGVLSGTPPGFGDYGLTFLVSDADGLTAQSSLVVTVTGDAPIPLEITTTALPQVNAGDRYAAVLSATGGSGNYSWTLLSSGGSGFTLTGDGILTGRAPSEGVYGLTFRVSDGSDTERKSLTIAVNGEASPLTVETTTLAGGTVNSPYAAVVTATGGTGSYTWTLLSSGGSGLSLTTNGVISGTPSSAGTFGLTVRVSDGNTTAVRSLTVAIDTDATDVPADPLTITTTTLPGTEPGAVYAAILNASGGTGGINYNWTLVNDGGSGLGLDADGVLSGAGPTPGTYGLTVRVNDGSATETRSLTLVSVGEGPQPLAITTASLPGGTAGSRYATVLDATGGAGSYVWTLLNDGGSGLLLDAEGVLSGTVLEPGDYALTVEVTDGAETTSRSLTLTIAGVGPLPLAISTATLPNATTGESYATTLAATGGEGTYSWTLPNDGSSGLTLDSEGILTGTVAAPGQYGLTVEVTDGTATVRRSLTLTVTGDGPEPLAIATTALPVATVGERFAETLAATGGAGPYSWTLLSDGQSGFTLNTQGILSGTATEPGNYGLTVELTDGTSTVATSLVLTVIGEGPQPLVLQTSTLPSATVGERYATVILASGGTGTYTWTLVNGGGSGLTLDANGVLSGTVAEPGNYALTIDVDDGADSVTASLTLTVVGEGPQPLLISTSALGAATTGTPYAAVLEATGGDGAYSWTLLENGGSGLVLDSAGILSGTVLSAGDFGLTVQVSDGSASVTRSLTLTVIGEGPQPVTVTTTTLPNATSGQAYAATLAASGGSGSYNWTLINAGGTGLLLDSEGILSGTVTVPGDYGLTVEVSDGSTSARRSLTLSVVGEEPLPLAVATTALPAATTNVAYAAVLTATGGTGSYTWTLLAAGGSGLSLANDGVLSGTVTEPGNYGLTVEVDDGDVTATRSLTLTVTGDGPQPLVITTTSLPAATAGQAYAATFAASGGTGSYSWSLINAGGTGLLLDSEGVISGTVTVPGAYGLTVEVSDGSDTTRLSLTLSVVGDEPQPLTISTTTLPGATAGTLYAAVLSASGGDSAAYNWTILEDGGSGLGILENVLSGTAPVAGVYGITVQVSDGTETAVASFTLTVAAGAETTLAITNTELAAAAVDVGYVAVLEAQGGSGDYSWSLISDGGSTLVLNTDGILSGTVTSPGSYGLTFEVDDGNTTVRRSLTLTVAVDGDQALTITTEVLPDAETTIYAAVLVAEGGIPPYVWSLDSDGGSGLLLSSDGALSGTVPAPGVYGLTVSVMDSDGAEDTRSLSLTVDGGPTPPIEIVTAVIPDPVAGEFYAVVLRATGGSGDYLWTLLDDGGAVGLGFDPDPSTTGVLSWSATDVIAGTFTINVQVQDADSPVSADVTTYTITVAP